MTYHQGFFSPNNPGKYKGDAKNIVYRSGWERHAFRWCDTNPGVAEWSSEEVVIPYRSPTNGRTRRYFPDLLIVMENGKTILAEIKPDKETRPPHKQKRTTRYLKEAVTFAFNAAKWEAADAYARSRGWDFQVWTEKTMTRDGIMPKTKYGRKKPRKKRPPTSRR